MPWEKSPHKNAQGEYYLTDVFKILQDQGEVIATYCTEMFMETLGINSRAQLAQGEEIIRGRILSHWLNEGVTIIDPNTTYIDEEVELSPDVIIQPFTILKGKTRIAEDAIIGHSYYFDRLYMRQGYKYNPYSRGKSSYRGESKDRPLCLFKTRDRTPCGSESRRFCRNKE